MEEILDQIADVFRRHGYEGATLSRLSAATGLGRASLYHHFPDGKADMAQAVAAHMSQNVMKQIFSRLEGEGSTRQKLEGFASGIIEFYDGGAKNCFLAAMTLTGGNTVLAEPMQRSVTRWIEKVSRILLEAGAEEKVALRRARMTVERIQGALIVARSLNDPQSFETTVRELPDMLLQGLE